MSRKTPGPSVSDSENTEHQWTRVTHMHTSEPEKRGPNSPEPEHTNTHSATVCASLHPCLCRLRAEGVWLGVVSQCWREPSGCSPAVRVGSEPVSHQPADVWSLKLVHDAVCVID